MTPGIVNEAGLWIDHVIEREERKILGSLNRILAGRLPLDVSMDRGLAVLSQLRDEDPVVAKLFDELDGLIQLGGRYLIEVSYRDDASYLDEVCSEA